MSWRIYGHCADGKAATLTGITILRLAEGKIVEYWSNADMLGLMRQLKHEEEQGE